MQSLNTCFKPGPTSYILLATMKVTECSKVALDV